MATDADFNEQIAATLRFEGGYVNDVNDAGGETNFGISKRSYPDVDIAGLSRDDAIDIYYNDYWLPLQPDKLPRLVAMKLFDMSVNMGQRAAVRLFQVAYINAGGAQQLVVDGILGRNTIAALNEMNAGPFLKYVRAEATRHYQMLAAKDLSKAQYLRGWLRRANA